MFNDLHKLLGTTSFFAIAAVAGGMWLWHQTGSNVAIIGTAENAIEQGRNAVQREAGVASGAESDAEIKREQARQAARRQKAEADEAEYRACTARIDAAVKTMSPSQLTSQPASAWRCNVAGNPAPSGDVAEGARCVKDMEDYLSSGKSDAATKDEFNSYTSAWGTRCNGNMTNEQRESLAIWAREHLAKMQATSAQCFTNIVAFDNSHIKLKISEILSFTDTWAGTCKGKLTGEQSKEATKIYNKMFERATAG